MRPAAMCRPRTIEPVDPTLAAVLGGVVGAALAASGAGAVLLQRARPAGCRVLARSRRTARRGHRAVGAAQLRGGDGAAGPGAAGQRAGARARHRPGEPAGGATNCSPWSGRSAATVRSGSATSRSSAAGLGRHPVRQRPGRAARQPAGAGAGRGPDQGAPHRCVRKDFVVNVEPRAEDADRRADAARGRGRRRLRRPGGRAPVLRPDAGGGEPARAVGARRSSQLSRLQGDDPLENPGPVDVGAVVERAVDRSGSTRRTAASTSWSRPTRAWRCSAVRTSW